MEAGRVGIMVSGKFNFDFQREALPHMIEPYQEAAQSLSVEQFVERVPYPFLIYVRSMLWDPLLLLSHEKGGRSRETAVVSYDMEAGGRSFMSPVRKRQTSPDIPSVQLGRDTSNDLVVPVNSISAFHCEFLPSRRGGQTWRCIDLDTTNGTYLREQRMTPNEPYELASGTYLRLGGNLIVYFLHANRVWEVLRSPTQLKAMIDV